MRKDHITGPISLWGKSQYRAKKGLSQRTGQRLRWAHNQTTRAAMALFQGVRCNHQLIPFHQLCASQLVYATTNCATDATRMEQSSASAAIMSWQSL
eukprot:1145159-Pelagomonas_calceolata.AAC.3